MITDELLMFVRQNLAAGTAKSDIEHALRKNGWHDEDIAAGFSTIENPQVPMPPQKKVPHLHDQINSKIHSEIQKVVRKEMAESYKLFSAEGLRNFSNSNSITKWMISKKIFAHQSEANVALIGVIILSVVVAGLIYSRSFARTPYTLHYDSPEIPHLQNPSTSGIH